ncbi:MAG: carbohydrate-binding protein, partial [Pseudomonadota bacterium]
MKAPSPQTLSKAVLGAALLPLATLASVAACASEAQPAPSDEGVYENYLDAPQTPGTWTYEDEPA